MLLIEQVYSLPRFDSHLFSRFLHRSAYYPEVGNWKTTTQSFQSRRLPRVATHVRTISFTMIERLLKTYRIAVKRRIRFAHTRQARED